MTITIDLDAPRFSALAEQAAGLGLSVEQLASDIIQSHLRSQSKPDDVADDEAFRRAMADTFRENAEVYRRLAQ